MNKSFLWIVLIGTAISFLIRIIALNQTSFANGWDTYFYLVQIQSLFEEGKMHSEEWTLLYPLLYLLCLIFEYIAAIKILSSFIAAFFTLALALISYQNSKSLLVSSFIISLTLFSPELTYFTSQWPKNLLGIDLLLFMLLFLTKRQFKWAFLFVVLGFFGHRLTAALSIFLFAGWYLFDYLNVKTIGIGIIAIFITLAIIQFFPGLLSIYDFQRLTDLIGQSLIIPPLEFLKLFGTYKISIFWQVEIWVYFLAFIFLGLNLIKDIFNKTCRKSLSIIFLMLLLLWLPIYRFTLEGAAYRFFHSGVLLAFLIPSFMINKPIVNQISRIGITILSSILFLISLFSYKSYNPALHDPPYKLYDNMTNKIISECFINDKPELIIAHKSLAEYITFSTIVDAMSWLPEYKIDDKKLYRIGYCPLKQLSNFYLGNKIIFLSGNYGYLKETDWIFFLDRLKSNESTDVVELHLDWKNPSRIRPSYLLKN